MNVIDFFKEIAAIPRPSGHEEKIRAFLTEKAQSLGYLTKIDEAGNLLITVEGKGTQANKPTLLLQNHMDMVTVKEDYIEKDFFTEGIDVYEEDGFLRAKGTTLGADNGIGIALAFYCASLDNHPPLELLVTVDEEAGLVGARGLKPNFFTADQAINLDSEEEGIFTVGCAGGGQADFSLPLEYDAKISLDNVYCLKYDGLLGGHSGGNIHENRASALVLLTKQLSYWQNNGISFNLININGGIAHNAIARSGSATIAFLSSDDAEKAKTLVLNQQKDYNNEVKYQQEFKKIDAAALKPLTVELTKKLVSLLASLQHGVIKFSETFPGIVETSANLAIIKTTEKAIEICYSYRSFSDAKVLEIQDKVATYIKENQIDVVLDEPYPGWQPAKENVLCDTMAKIYKDFVGKEPEIAPIHAGLECGYLIKTNADLVTISLGPNISDPHSPSEKVEIASVERTALLLKETMSKI